MKTFYPKFTKKLLSKCLSFTETKIQITVGEIKKQYTIRENRYFTEKTRGWRRSGIYLMLLWGAYDGTEKCNFIGTFLSEKKSVKFLIKVKLGYTGMTDGISNVWGKSGT